MPLPTEETDNIPLDVCCTTIYDVAEALLDSAHTALLDCLDPNCDEVVHFVSTGEPSFTEDGNYLACWLQALVPASGSRSTPSRPLFVRPVGTYGFKLIETGYPTLESGNVTISVPQADRIHAISRHSYSHIERIIRQQNADFSGSANLPRGGVCGGARMGQLSPLFRSGGQAGWQWSVTLTMDWLPVNSGAS